MICKCLQKNKPNVRYPRAEILRRAIDIFRNQSNEPKKRERERNIQLTAISSILGPTSSFRILQQYFSTSSSFSLIALTDHSHLYLIYCRYRVECIITALQSSYLYIYNVQSSPIVQILLFVRLHCPKGLK